MDRYCRCVDTIPGQKHDSERRWLEVDMYFALNLYALQKSPDILIGQRVIARNFNVALHSFEPCETI